MPVNLTKTCTGITPYIVELPHAPDADPAVSGRIVVGELPAFCPFEPRRIYWIHGMAANERRGQHAHRTLWQAMIAMHGKVEVALDNGHENQSFVLEKPTRCLIVPPGLWRDILSLEADSLLVVLASQPYEESDYIRNYEEFLAFRGIR